MMITPVNSLRYIDLHDKGNYNVKKGDSMQYQFNFINSSFNNLIGAGYLLENGTYVRTNLTTGEDITVSVLDSNKTVVEYNVSFTKKQSNNDLVLPIISPAGFINIAFAKKSILNQYVASMNQNNPSPIMSYDDNFIYFNGNFTANYGLAPITYSYNWHTGWLENFSVKIQYKQGNEISVLNMKRIHDDNTNNLSNVVNDVFNIGILLAIIAISIITFLSLKFLFCTK